MAPLLLLLLLLLATAHGLGECPDASGAAGGSPTAPTCGGALGVHIEGDRAQSGAPSVQVTLGYTPELASSALVGRITASTFVLEQPRCVFERFPTENIWLVVAVPEAVNDFNNSLGPGTPERAFQEFPSPARAYMTLNTTLPNYACPKPSEGIAVLHVGIETSCANDTSRPTCNGPLPGSGPYQVKFLAFNGSVPVAETQWSLPITLRTAEDPSSIPVPGSGHSGGMIALTTILSILFAILLAGLLAMLVFCSDTCDVSGSFSKPEVVSVRRYNTHHVYDQPAARL
ncbi:uroplakin-3b-like protein 1 [Dryobates pubescens]|uniref:uroplakin-3b-like protein 1 n=1 Tax=Dryobates pubescens TaxID=118200 RepID=UPI0023B9B535|nr:uroplakin-3b-like protein 1 [Dryobates pubescens]